MGMPDGVSGSVDVLSFLNSDIFFSVKIWSSCGGKNTSLEREKTFRRWAKIFPQMNVVLSSITFCASSRRTINTETENP